MVCTFLYMVFGTICRWYLTVQNLMLLILVLRTDMLMCCYLVKVTSFEHSQTLSVLQCRHFSRVCGRAGPQLQLLSACDA